MLEIKNLNKIYKKEKNKALDNVSFTIKKGEFVALLGQNGAGKSTLINILAGNVKKNSGAVKIGGYDLDKEELKTKKIIGVVPQEISFDVFFNVNEVLYNQSGYFGINKNENYINELLQTLSLKNKKKINTRKLSGGMRRRLLIAKALVHKPDLLILDEPTAGVDIELRRSLYSFLKKLHQSGITIILTTHYLEEAEKLCDRIIVIDHGKLIMDDLKQNLMNNFDNKLVIEFYFDTVLDINNFNFISEYLPKITDKRKLTLVALKKDIPKLFQKMTNNNIKYVNFKLEDSKLEDVFLKLIKNQE